MAIGQVDRRLSAILGDAAGYSRAMRANEVGTFNTLKDHRSNAIDPGRYFWSLDDCASAALYSPHRRGLYAR